MVQFRYQRGNATRQVPKTQRSRTRCVLKRQSSIRLDGGSVISMRGSHTHLDEMNLTLVNLRRTGGHLDTIDESLSITHNDNAGFLHRLRLTPGQAVMHLEVEVAAIGIHLQAKHRA